MGKKLFVALFVSSLVAFSTITATAQVQVDAEPNIEQVSINLAKGVKRTMSAKKNESYRQGLAAYITSVNQNVSDVEAIKIVDSVLDSAEKYDVDEKLVMAIAHTESTYYTDAISHTDFKGIMQTSDLLAREAGYTPKQLFHPEVSIDVGTSYIDEKLTEFGDTRLALTAYNQGAGSIYSGNYSMDYADLAMERIEEVEDFLVKQGYVNVYN